MQNAKVDHVTATPTTLLLTIRVELGGGQFTQSRLKVRLSEVAGGDIHELLEGLNGEASRRLSQRWQELDELPF